MAKLRIALAQVTSTVGDLAGNAQTIVEWTRRAAGHGASLAVFPEMMLTGYPVEDLALRASFVDASISMLNDLAGRLADEGLGGTAVVTGYPVSIISGNSTRSAPRPAARRVHSTIVCEFPARSPTVEFTWASAILSFATLPA